MSKLNKTRSSSSSSVFDRASKEFLNRLQEVKTQEADPKTIEPKSYFQMAIDEPKPPAAVVIRQPGTAKQRVLMDDAKRRAHRETMQEKLRAFREGEREQRWDKVRGLTLKSVDIVTQKTQDEDIPMISTPTPSPPPRVSAKSKEVPKTPTAGKKSTNAGPGLDKFQLDLVESSIATAPYHRTRSPTPNVKKLLAKMGKSVNLRSKIKFGRHCITVT